MKVTKIIRPSLDSLLASWLSFFRSFTTSTCSCGVKSRMRQCRLRLPNISDEHFIPAEPVSKERIVQIYGEVHLAPLMLIFPICFLLALSSMAQTGGPPLVTLSPGDNLQAAVDAAPAGTTFTLQLGVYRMQRIAPKDGDLFVGQGTVVLNGSRVLTFQPHPSGLWVASASPLYSGKFPCAKAEPLCDQIQDLFVDNVIQKPATTPVGLQPGWWFYDLKHQRIFLPVNPAGHTVELGATPCAFYGTAKDVQIRGVIVEKYATHAQQGAIGDLKEGSGWTVDQVDVRWNHGAGVELGPGSTLSDSHIDHNGQLGVAMTGAGGRIIGNDISWNNYAGFETGWEAGGSKFWATTNLLVQSNYVHDNQGPGLWSDFNNVGTVYEHNTVTNNLNEGIKYEISYRATIRNNVVEGNGNTLTVWLWNAQIELQNSSDSAVYGNVVEVPAAGGNGIAVINQKRGSGSQGPWMGRNDRVYNNTITYLGPDGHSGFVDDTSSTTALNNSFDSNHYILKVRPSSRFHWNWIKGMDWNGFRAAGQESHGTCR